MTSDVGGESNLVTFKTDQHVLVFHPVAAMLFVLVLCEKKEFTVESPECLSGWCASSLFNIVVNVKVSLQHQLRQCFDYNSLRLFLFGLFKTMLWNIIHVIRTFFWRN